ncbi:MAG: bifunctional UDP-N-acetylglucosamine diphosphorylase/glucosamine-1-phosphate N-acetyltransferase GlmU [Pseudomonadota bacterium]
MSLSIVILAAGQGTRMRSSKPKVLQPLAGRALLEHVIDCAEGLDADSVHVVYGFGGDQVTDALSHRKVSWVLQAEQLGTGHAVAQAMPNVSDDDCVLVLYGDVPLVRTETLDPLVQGAKAGSLVILSARLDNPHGYGRIVRNTDGVVQSIVEQKDASPDQQKINEINTGLLAVPAKHLRRWLGSLSNNNAQGEYYLTDVAEMAVKDGVAIEAIVAADVAETQGINDKIQLAEAESTYRQMRTRELMVSGATLLDPSRVDVRGNVTIGKDVTIDVDVILEGEVVLGDGVTVGPFSHLKDVSIGADSNIHSHSVLDQALVGQRCNIGPYARIRPGTELADQAKIGNFVETKKAQIGEGSKVNHLTYVGDSIIGQNVNVGAGTITCNYDGANKHQTVIGDDAFIGSGTQLVAPVTVGSGANIGAGSVITKDAPADTLTVGRARQVEIKGWTRPTKKPKTET